MVEPQHQQQQQQPSKAMSELADAFMEFIRRAAIQQRYETSGQRELDEQKILEEEY